MKHVARYLICSMFALLLAFGLILNVGQANAAVKVFGIGEIGESFIEILVDEELGSPMGIVMFFDHLNNKMVFGEVASVAAESTTKINFSGTYITVDEAGVETSSTFQASAEDLGTGDGVDKFSITLSDGYTKSAVLDRGEIEIIQ